MLRFNITEIGNDACHNAVLTVRFGSGEWHRASILLAGYWCAWQQQCLLYAGQVIVLLWQAIAAAGYGRRVHIDAQHVHETIRDNKYPFGAKQIYVWLETGICFGRGILCVHCQVAIQAVSVVKGICIWTVLVHLILYYMYWLVLLTWTVIVELFTLQTTKFRNFNICYIAFFTLLCSSTVHQQNLFICILPLCHGDSLEIVHHMIIEQSSWKEVSKFFVRLKEPKV